VPAAHSSAALCSAGAAEDPFTQPAVLAFAGLRAITSRATARLRAASA
jgi:hypothetical protein